REPFADLLSAGSHGTTFGGTPLGCAVALKILEVIERERLADNARVVGQWLRSALDGLVQRYPGVLRSARGLGLMLGLELVEKEKIRALSASDKNVSTLFVNRLHEAGLLTIP